MAIAGKCYIVPDQATKSWRLVVHNTGTTVVGVTNNIFPTKKQAETEARHDDYTRYGHGLLAQPNGVSWQAFQQGQPYLGRPIAEGQFIRVGLRGAAWAVMQLPPLDGAPVEVDFKDFVWYGQRVETANMAGYQVAGQKTNVSDSKSILNQILQLTTLKTKGIRCEGEVKITAVPNKHGQLSHWEVSIENTGKQPFIGTVVFEGAEKNDGIGLESMAVPNAGSRAVQRIEAMGNYGVQAAPGAKVRIGIRGYSYGELALPPRGSVSMKVNEMTLDTSMMADEFFEKKLVEQKRQEKLAKVQFFEGDKAINGEIKPVVYRGAEAKTRATFDAPELVVKAVPHSDETPGGGWLIELKSKLPAKDNVGEVGFVATLKLGATGWDPAQLPPKKFEAPDEVKTWFLPKDAKLNEHTAQAGEELVIGTRGLGWFAVVPLPKDGETVDTTKQFDCWGLREDQVARRNLSREFTSKCRN